MSRKVYVASSWANDRQLDIVLMLRKAGHEVYDFKNPTEADTGFHWSQVGMESYNRSAGQLTVPVAEYLQGIKHPIAEAGFKSDLDAMKWADTCVLVLPCGRSAHLELGWFVGKSKPTCILLDGPFVTPELMYKMVNKITSEETKMVEWVDSLVGPGSLRGAIRQIMDEGPSRGMSAVEVQQAISARWPDSWRFVTVIDIADELQAMYGRG